MASGAKAQAKKAAFHREETMNWSSQGSVCAGRQERDTHSAKQLRRGRDHSGSDAKRQADWVFYTLHAHEAHLKREVPAEFIETFARACIDAGADAFIGHGPHVLRGIEIYRGKPIFYSLGNFIFQNDLIRKHPQDIYDKVGQGLTMGSTPADMYDARSRNDTRGFPSDVAYWESVLGSLEFAGGEFRRATLYPLYLGWDNPRSQRGRPTLAREEIAKRILERLQTLSEPYGTNLRIEGEVGIIEV